MFLIRRFQICVLIIALVIPFQSFPVQAVSPAAIATGNSTFRSDFPQGVLATLEITPEAYIQNARLNVTLDGTVLNSTDAIVPAHQPGDTITVEARWNGRSLTRDPSPPWMPLQLWWTVVDSTGNSIQTTPENHIYTDETNRRPWATTEGMYVTVHTYNQGGSFIQQAAAIGDDAVARLQLIFGYGLPFRPALVFYNQAADGDADFGSGLSVPFGGYVVGRAYPGTSGVVMLARSDSAYMQRTITHELTHLYQYQLGPQLFDAPHWWIEGDAKAQEPADSIYHSLDYTRDAAFNGGLPYLPTWETRNYNSEATLNQALYVGASFVIFLREIYGAQSHAAFYQSWRATSDFNLSFELTFGLNLAGLTQQWQDWIVNNNTVVSPGITDTTVAEVELPPPPEPLPEGLARVNIYLLNFRTGPTEDHDVLYTLRAGQLLLPIGRNESGEWILAELPDGTQGWLLAEFLDYDESIENLTVSLFY